MYEELYVIKDEDRMLLDLNTPSGITLNFKSNLFGDLSKIGSSYSYTFKLPMTINNRIILDNAEEIRHRSNMIRKRLKAEFYQNGVNLFTNANLYISELAGDSYSAVLTWDVNDSFEKLKNDDVSITKLEIPNKGVVQTGKVRTLPCLESFSNIDDSLNVVYNCGLPFYSFDVNSSVSPGNFPNHITNSGAYPLPVVPVYRILKLIEAKFGIKCRLGRSMSIGEYRITQGEEDIINRGVIPVVGRDLSDEDLIKYRCALDSPSLAYINSANHSSNLKTILKFYPVRVFNTNIPTSENSDFWAHSEIVIGSTSSRSVAPLYDFMRFNIDGCFSVALDEMYDNENEIRLSIMQLQCKFEKGQSDTPIYFWKELASMTGLADGNRYQFDFSTINGRERLECSNVMRGGHIMFHINYKVKDLIVDNPIKIYLLNDEKCTAPHPISLIPNLPDVSCLTFLKSLFFMIGAYPCMNTDGEIEPQFYSKLQNNLVSGNTYDWSEKDKSEAYTSPDSIKFALSEFAQNNYYLMKSDSSDNSNNSKSDETDVYASGIGNLIVGNEVLEKTKTIVQLPFYGEFIRNKKWPSYDTGSTLKLWEPSDDEPPTWSKSSILKFCNGKPCYGVIEDRRRTSTNSNGGAVSTGNVMTMKVWNGFRSMNSNPSYAYLQKIISNPYVIKMNMDLSEFDLRDIDYLKPIYLNKFNSYFAVVSITRDSKGFCKVELIKLPND